MPCWRTAKICESAAMSPVQPEQASVGTASEITTPNVVAFHFDLMCPYAFQTSLWMREVRDQLGLRVDWRFFSLEEVNRAASRKEGTIGARFVDTIAKNTFPWQNVSCLGPQRTMAVDPLSTRASMQNSMFLQRYEK